MKMNINVGPESDNNLQQNSLDHLNRSLNMHQMSMAFSNNQSYQQSPPNIRNKNIMMHHPSHGYNHATIQHHQ